MSSEDVVNQLNLKDYKRISKAKYAGAEYRVFFNQQNEDIKLTKEKDGIISNLELIISNQNVKNLLYYSIENDTQLKNEFESKTYSSYQEALDSLCCLFKNNDVYFIENCIADVTSRSYGELKLGKLIKSLECFFDAKKIIHEKENYFENEKVAECVMMPQIYSEDLDNACFSCILNYDKISKKANFSIATD